MDHQRITSKSINIDNKLTKPFRSLMNPGMKCLTVQRQKDIKLTIKHVNSHLHPSPQNLQTTLKKKKKTYE